jgi:predicted solute-binding protein
VELPRLRLEIVPGTGIASRGPVRSILLVSKVPRDKIRVLAADATSRTSVRLARILLARNNGVRPRVISLAPDLPAMLKQLKPALIIGDNASRGHLCLSRSSTWEKNGPQPQAFRWSSPFGPDVKERQPRIWRSPS